MIYTMQILSAILLSGVLSVMFVGSVSHPEKKGAIIEMIVWGLAILALAFIFRTVTW